MAATHLPVLILHGSRFGQSTKIAQALADQLRGGGHEAELQALTRDSAPDPDRHGGLVLVTSVRYGYFDKNAYKFIARHRAWLESVPSLLVTVSLTARTPQKRDPAVHSYTRKFLEKSGWAPHQVEVVAGALEYPRYHLLDRLAIQLIMTITKGPTDPTVTIEYTDWDQVGAAGARFAARLPSDDPKATLV